MKVYYNSEIEGMIDFYENIGYSNLVDYSCNTDGRINSCLIEFKLNFSDFLSHKKQIERYLKSYNSIAKEIPLNVLLIDINNRKYIKGIVTTTNKGIFIEWNDEQKHWSTPSEFIQFFNCKAYCKGWIDEESIISYNNLFCSINNKKTTSKDEVKTELINPKKINIHKFEWFKQLEIEKNNIGLNNWLTFNMNMLGSEILKKQLGAFFTPDVYLKISTEYLRNAIKNVPAGMDYVIIDRCSGTGNLEKFLSNEELSHCILNTIDYTEWTTLKGLYDGRVRHIIPYTSETRNEENGLMKSGDALQKEFYDNLLPLIEDKYVIMLENPPYADVGGKSGGHNKDKEKSYINKKMIELIGGNECNELGHQFIWSAWEYIKPNEYILFSPIKYWKLYNLSNRKFINGTLCKSELFNTPNKFAISLIHWEKTIEHNNTIEVNIENTKEKVVIKKCIEKFKYDKNIYDSNPIANYRAESFMLGTQNVYLSNNQNDTVLWKRTKPFYKENILDIMPLFVSKLKYNYYDSWTEKIIIFNSFDGQNNYKSDIDFKNNCLLYSCLIDYNQCISNNFILNELCLLQNTISDLILNNYFENHNLIKLWKDVLIEIENKYEYNKNLKYGLYQIQKEINIKEKSGHYKKTGEEILILKYPILDEKIKILKNELKIFYINILQPKLFQYELLK